MIPTMELRFVEREVIETTQVYDNGTSIGVKRKVRILQQKWEGYVFTGTANNSRQVHEVAWRDIPLEKE